MNALRNPSPRFAIEALAIVVAAAVPAILHESWQVIIVAVLIVLILSAVIELVVTRRLKPQAVMVPAAPLPVVEVAAALPVLEAAPEPESEPEPEPEPEPEMQADVVVEQAAATVFELTPAPDPVTPAAPLAGPFTIAQLEQAVGAQEAPDDELLFMLGYLRDYAEADGSLPGEFDGLVVESFGHLLRP